MFSEFCPFYLNNIFRESITWPFKVKNVNSLDFDRCALVNWHFVADILVSQICSDVRDPVAQCACIGPFPELPQILSVWSPGSQLLPHSVPAVAFTVWGPTPFRCLTPSSGTPTSLGSPTCPNSGGMPPHRTGLCHRGQTVQPGSVCGG